MKYRICYADNTRTATNRQVEIVAVLPAAAPGGEDEISAVTGRVFVAKTPERFTYDADGNMTSDGRFAYFWNDENRMASSSNAEVVVTYAYDHKGRMIRKAIARRDAEPQSIGYVWDGWNIVRETHVSGLVSNVTYNLWGLDLDGTMQGAGGVGGLLAVIRNGETYIPTYDANGNISEYIDSSDGTVAAHYDYSPFGEPLVASGPVASSFTHRFSTKPQCCETKLGVDRLFMINYTLGRMIGGNLRHEEFQSRINMNSISGNDGLNLLYPVRSKYIDVKKRSMSNFNNRKLATTFFKRDETYVKNSNCKGACAGGRLEVRSRVRLEIYVDKSNPDYDKIVNHENHHVLDAYMAIFALQDIAGMLKWECELARCHNAKLELVLAMSEFFRFKYDLDQSVFDCLETGERCIDVQKYLGELQILGNDLQQLNSKVEEECGK